MSREEMKQAIMNDEYLVQTNRFRKMQDEHGTQRVLDTSEYESGLGKVVQTMLYEGDTTNWRMTGMLESVYDAEGNEVV